MNSEPTAHRGSILLAATLAAFVTPFMVSSINVALPVIGREFSLGSLALSWVATSYILSAAMFLLPFGRLADIFGRRKTFLAGMTVYSVAAGLCAAAWNGPSLIAFRFLQGMGGAMVFSTGVALLTSAYPPGERGRVLGINVAAVYVGLSLGPFVGGFLTDQVGWRSLFVANLPLGAAAVAVLGLRVKGDWAESAGEGFDLIGAALYGFSLATAMVGTTFLPGSWAMALVAAGTLGVILFAVRERGRMSPLLNMDLLLKNPVFAFSNLAALINYSATFAVGFLVSLYLQYACCMEPRQAGLVLVSQPAMMAIFSPLAGRLSDRVQPRILSSVGMGITTLGLALLVFVTPDGGQAYMIVCLLILGFGFALFSSPNVNAVMSSVEKRHLGVAGSTLGTMRLIGQMASMAIATLLFAFYLGGKPIGPANLPAFQSAVRTAFVIFALLCFAGIFASLARGSIQRNQDAKP